MAGWWCAVLLAVAAEEHDDPDVVEQMEREGIPLVAPVLPEPAPRRAPSVDPPPTVAIDLHPLATGVLALLGILHVPITAVVPFGERFAATLELAFSFNGKAPAGTGWAVSGSVGVQVGFGRSPLNGFYIGPKFGLLVRRAAQVLASQAAGSPDGPLDFGASVMRAFMCGVDAGWQWQIGHVHAALGLGVSAGYGYEVSSPFVSVVDATVSFQRTQGFVVAADIGMLRVGLAL